MSYSLRTPATAKTDLPQALTDARAKVEEHLDEAMDDHVDAALEAIPALAETVGRPEDHVMISVAGHANPGHAPVEGWSDDTLTISISVAAPTPVTDEAEPTE